MNTAGHHSVADTAGLPVLKEAFARVGASPRLNCFYMGNWLTDVSQAVLVSHIDLVGSVLDALGIPHENGFFAKKMDPQPYFTEGWEQRVYEKFHGTCPEALLIFYINHLRWELLAAEDLYRPVSATPSLSSECGVQ